VPFAPERSRLRLKMPLEFTASERSARAVHSGAAATPAAPSPPPDADAALPHPSAKHYLRPLPLVALIVSHNDAEGLLPALLAPAATALRGEIRVALDALHADLPSPRWTPPSAAGPHVTPVAATVPAHATPADVARRLAFADLIARLLVYEPSARLTAAEALAHPFFACDPARAAARVASNAQIRARRGDFFMPISAARSGVDSQNAATDGAFAPARAQVQSLAAPVPRRDASSIAGGPDGTALLTAPARPRTLTLSADAPSFAPSF
jgi:hypothetical protein